MEDQTHEQRHLVDLLNQLEWLKRYGLIDGYSASAAGDVGEVVLSEAAAQLVRAGRQPITEPGFILAAAYGPEAAREWLAREAGALRPGAAGQPD